MKKAKRKNYVEREKVIPSFVVKINEDEYIILRDNLYSCTFGQIIKSDNLESWLLSFWFQYKNRNITEMSEVKIDTLIAIQCVKDAFGSVEILDKVEFEDMTSVLEFAKFVSNYKKMKKLTK